MWTFPLASLPLFGMPPWGKATHYRQGSDRGRKSVPTLCLLPFLLLLLLKCIPLEGQMQTPHTTKKNLCPIPGEGGRGAGASLSTLMLTLLFRLQGLDPQQMCVSRNSPFPPEYLETLLIRFAGWNSANRWERVSLIPSPPACGLVPVHPRTTYRTRQRLFPVHA